MKIEKKVFVETEKVNKLLTNIPKGNIIENNVANWCWSEASQW